MEVILAFGKDGQDAIVSPCSFPLLCEEEHSVWP